MTFEFPYSHLCLFGLDFPVIIWPIWPITLAMLVFGRGPGYVNGWWYGLVSRKKDPIGYWIGVAPFIVLSFAVTAMFNSHIFQ